MDTALFAQRKFENNIVPLKFIDQMQPQFAPPVPLARRAFQKVAPGVSPGSIAAMRQSPGRGGRFMRVFQGHNTTSLLNYCGKSNAAFTLIELLLVVFVMILVMSFATPAVNSMLQGNSVTVGGQMVSDEFKLARQISSSSNRTVEIWFSTMSPLIPSSANSPGYNAMQLWTMVPVPLTGTNSSNVATYVPASKLTLLPSGVAISANQSSPTSGKPGLSGLFYWCTPNTIPNGYPNAGANYLGLQVRPSGLVVPLYAAAGGGAAKIPATGMNELYLTVVPLQYAGVGTITTTPPPNYATIQINPSTGSSIIYRP